MHSRACWTALVETAKPRSFLGVVAIVGRGMARLAVLMCLGASVSARQSSELASEDLAQLTLDQLIGRLPRVGSEWIREGSPWHLVPVAQEFRARIERGADLTSEQWKRALFSTGAVRMRPRWVVSEPFAISMKDLGWLPYTKMVLDPRGESLANAEAGW